MDAAAVELWERSRAEQLTRGQRCRASARFKLVPHLPLHVVDGAAGSVAVGAVVLVVDLLDGVVHLVLHLKTHRLRSLDALDRQSRGEGCSLAHLCSVDVAQHHHHTLSNEHQQQNGGELQRNKNT